jgi:hypothetical protein
VNHVTKNENRAESSFCPWAKKNINEIRTTIMLMELQIVKQRFGKIGFGHQPDVISDEAVYYNSDQYIKL